MVIVNWSQVDHVLLDMDGTLLDLHFDNVFWQQRVPERYAELHGLASMQAALEKITPDFLAMQGQLEWYCLDYWSDTLGLDVPAIKREMAAELPSKVQIRPHTLAFLDALHQAGKVVWLATNAHPQAVEIKFAQLEIGDEPIHMDSYFDRIVTSHTYGAPKESMQFWQKLHAEHPFDPAHTLFVDDSLSVLAAAASFGIAQCVAINHPDSQQARKDISEFPAITYFNEIMPLK